MRYQSGLRRPDPKNENFKLISGFWATFYRQKPSQFLKNKMINININLQIKHDSDRKTQDHPDSVADLKNFLEFRILGRTATIDLFKHKNFDKNEKNS